MIGGLICTILAFIAGFVLGMVVFIGEIEE